jgi:hypothetical protein
MDGCGMVAYDLIVDARSGSPYPKFSGFQKLSICTRYVSLPVDHLMIGYKTNAILFQEYHHMGMTKLFLVHIFTVLMNDL